MEPPYAGVEVGDVGELDPVEKSPPVAEVLELGDQLFPPIPGVICAGLLDVDMGLPKPPADAAPTELGVDP